jgi:hypothetical protein
MNESQIRQLIGDEVANLIGIESLVEASNAFAHEGIEWLPSYKLALSLLAHALGRYDAAFSKLILAYGERSSSAIALQAIKSECQQIWNAHCLVVLNGPEVTR